ncbi:MAG: TrkH family potassium uptake protein [Clostridiales bacterium]|nr:TrkH family potassium uptake protein [Clostridiales bacterium]
MNKRLVLRLLGAILLIEALAMSPSLLIALVCGDGDAMAFALTIGTLCIMGLPLWFLVKPIKPNLRAREGFVVVALSWLVLSGFGAMPFVLSGVIPNYVDAFFEAVSGFTTTGATIMTSFDEPMRGIMFWRSFTHWIGGMGVLVLTLALLPQMTGRTSHLVRAESPGPSLSKIVPKMGDSAKILYMMYGALTAIQFAILVIAGLSPYDAAIHTMGTAGTGGFSNYGLSVGAFQSPVVDVIITVFMVLFGINFALFYRVLTGAWRDMLKSEELHWYLGLFGAATVAICILLMPTYGNVFQSLRYSSFQVASVMSTTGYATADFNLWPQAAKMILILLMFVGSCAGSTAGGLKVVRLALLCKISGREVRHTFQPRKVQVVRFEGKGVEESLLTQVAVFFFVYILMILMGALLVSFEGRFDFETNFTAALTCASNVGPGFSMVGPMENFAGYGPMAKIVLSILMLAGRLEIFPILVIFHPSVWKK